MQVRKIVTRPFRESARQITAAGLGGERILQTFRKEDAHAQIIIEALLQGFSYLDCARVYAGSEQYDRGVF